jgi:nickel transport protein
MIDVKQAIFALAIALTMSLAVPKAAPSHEVAVRANIQARTANGVATYSENNLPRNAQVSAIEIVAYYSTGEPMADGQVRVYAPGDSEPWRTGRCDRQGRYTFTPNLSRRGRWTVRVESEGHSNFINIVL